MMPPAPCGKADTCEHCPFPDCIWNGNSGFVYTTPIGDNNHDQ